MEKGSNFETFWVLAVNQEVQISQLLFFIRTLCQLVSGRSDEWIETHEILPLCFLLVMKSLSNLEIHGIHLQVDLTQQLAFV